MSPNQHAIIVRVDEKGNILESLHDTSGRLSFMTEVVEYGDSLFIGGATNNFIGRLAILWFYQLTF